MFVIQYQLHLTKGKSKVEVRFRTIEGKIAGGIYGIRIFNEGYKYKTIVF
jgi:hypothetical protein